MWMIPPNSPRFHLLLFTFNPYRGWGGYLIENIETFIKARILPNVDNKGINP